MTLEEMLKDQVWTCGVCNGPLYVHPYLCEVELGGRERKIRQEIKTINYCPVCWEKSKSTASLETPQ